MEMLWEMHWCFLWAVMFRAQIGFPTPSIHKSLPGIHGGGQIAHMLQWSEPDFFKLPYSAPLTFEADFYA